MIGPYRLVIPSRAAPQGSKMAFAMIDKRTGKPRAIMKEQSKRHAPFRALATVCAQQADGPPTPLTGPTRVDWMTTYQRPLSHYKGSGALKPDAPAYPINTQTGDKDKLERSIYDSLTKAGWLADDSIVVAGTGLGPQNAYKVYVDRDEPEQTTIVVSSLPPSVKPATVYKTLAGDLKMYEDPDPRLFGDA